LVQMTRQAEQEWLGSEERESLKLSLKALFYNL